MATTAGPSSNFKPSSQRKRDLMDRAMQRYNEEIRDSYDLESIISTESIEDLHFNTQQVADASIRKLLLGSLSRLKPGLLYLHDFMSALAVCVGADAKITALIWGSIRLMLMISAPLAGMLDNVTDMLEDLTYTLPKLATYAEEYPPNPRFDECLINVYSETIWFCAHTIKFFRMHRSHLSLLKQYWPKAADELTRSIKRLKRHSDQVELEAEAIRHRLNPQSQQHLNELVSQLTVGTDYVSQPSKRYFHVPFSLNERFVPRPDLVDRVSEALDPKPGEQKPRSLALYGTGGVGKTQTSLQYAHRAYKSNTFDAIFWISADSHTRMLRDYLEIARQLRLVGEDAGSLNSADAMNKTKAWLRSSSCSWLLIFDNADDLSILRHGWPGGFLGSILITTRDYTAAFDPASDGLQLQVFDETGGADAFIHILGPDYDTPKNRALARELNTIVGGLPLALNQISTYIRGQRLALDEFMALYKKRQRKIHEKKPQGFDAEHTVATLWTMNLNKLSGDAATLQRLLAFFEPDAISEALLIQGAEGLRSKGSAVELEFLIDAFDFNEAKMSLFRASLIDRDSEKRTLSLHRLLQTAVTHELDKSAKERYFILALHLLKEVFPSSWSDDSDSDGFVYDQWELCSMCLPHVLFLAKNFAGELDPQLPQSEVLNFLEVLSRSAWFLYETEEYSECQAVMKICLKIEEIFKLEDTLAHARTITFLGLIDVDLALPARALQYFNDGYQIRNLGADKDDWIIPLSMSNIGLAYTEIGDLEQAMLYHSRAFEFRKRISCRLLDNSQANIASLLLRMGKPEEAEKMYRSVKGLENFTDSDLLREDKPRYAGGLYLISMIREAQGYTEVALDQMMKVLEFRKQKFGARFKTCNTLCRIAYLLTKLGPPSGKPVYNTLHDTVPSQGHLQRAQDHLNEAIAARNIVLGRVDYHQAASLAETEEEAYVRLVPWLLW